MKRTPSATTTCLCMLVDTFAYSGGVLLNFIILNQMVSVNTFGNNQTIFAFLEHAGETIPQGYGYPQGQLDGVKS